MKLLIFCVLLVYTTTEDVRSHAIDTAKMLMAAKKLNILAATCKSCFTEETNKKNATTTTENESTPAATNLTIEDEIEPIFKGVGKVALKNEEEMYDDEGTPIDAEITIIIKVNKNSNNTVVVKKLLLDNLGNLQLGLGENQHK